MQVLELASFSRRAAMLLHLEAHARNTAQDDYSHRRSLMIQTAAPIDACGPRLEMTYNQRLPSRAVLAADASIVR